MKPDSPQNESTLKDHHQFHRCNVLGFDESPLEPVLGSEFEVGELRRSVPSVGDRFILSALPSVLR